MTFYVMPVRSGVAHAPVQITKAQLWRILPVASRSWIDQTPERAMKLTLK
jgi:hypothetical protein